MSVLPRVALVVLLLLAPGHAVGADWAPDPSRIRASLQSPDVQMRLSGLAALGRYSSAEREALVVKAMQDESLQVRLAAAEVAIKFHYPLGELVVPWLSSAHLEMRYAAVRLLEGVPFDRALPELQRMMGDKEARVREAAVRALATSEDESSTAVLMRGTSDVSLSVRTAALRALAVRGGQAVDLTLLSMLAASEPELRAGVEIALYSRGTIDSETLRQHLRSERSKAVRVSVVGALGAMNRLVDVDLLLQLIEPDQPLEVLRLATAAIVRHPPTGDWMNRLLERWGRLGDAHARDSVAEALAEHAEVALALVDRCQKSKPLDEPRPCLLLCKYSGCRVEDVERASRFERAGASPDILACGSWSRVEELSWVTAQIQRQDDSQWSAGARVLRRLLINKRSHVLQGEFESLLRAKTPGTSDYRDALSLLGLAGGERAKSRLLAVALAEHASELDVVAALTALREAELATLPVELFALLNHPSLNVARATADLFMSTGSAVSVLPWFSAADRDGRRRALRFLSIGAQVSHATDEATLAEISARVAGGSGPELDPLVEGVARNTSVRAQSLATQFSKSPDPWVRMRVASALAKTPVAAQVLAELLEDSRPSVRAEAAHSLGRIGARSHRSQLVRHLGDEAVSVAFNAMVALGKLATHREVPIAQQTCEWLVDPSQWRQVAALSALLAAKKRCDAAPESRLLLTSSSREIRRLAATLVQRSRSDSDAKTLGLCAYFDQDLEVRRTCAGSSGEPTRSPGSSRRWVQISSTRGPANGALAGTLVAVRTTVGTIRMAVTDRLGGLSCTRAEDCPEKIWMVPDATGAEIF